MPEFYVIDTRTHEIVNCVTTGTAYGAQKAVERMADAEHLIFTSEPAREMLKQYRYWNVRP